jgi:hypothetical protein
VAAACLAGAIVLAVVASPVPIALRGATLIETVRGSLGAAEESSDGALRVAMFGDSTALAVWAGLGHWLRRQVGVQPVNGLVTMGCGVMRIGEMENRGRWGVESEKCARMAERWKEAAIANRADVAIVLVGPWEARNRRFQHEGPVVALGDPVIDQAAHDAIAAAIDALASTGAKIVWLTSPRIRIQPLKGKLFDSDVAASDPSRIDRFNELVREVAGSRRDVVRVVDLGLYLRSREGGEFDAALRTDGVHFSIEGAGEIARQWLGPQILRETRQLRGTETGVSRYRPRHAGHAKSSDQATELGPDRLVAIHRHRASRAAAVAPYRM